MLKISFARIATLTVALAFSASACAQDNDLADEVKKLSEEEQIELLMGTGSPVKLFNFESQEWDEIQRVDELVASSFKKYLPPIPEVQEIYDLRISEGQHPYEAYMTSMVELERAMQDL